jgi:pimeloyl-ACP methyl ester carboxylesterase
VSEGTVSTAEANGLDIAYLESGPRGGPLALCLHGFPDTAHTWRHLLPRLGGEGYHAVAPFLRGYAPTGLPADGNYQTAALARDLNALHEALGGSGDAVVIGHDWGALATYLAVTHRPECWRRAVTAAVPPPASVMRAFFTYDQLKRSWYTFFFQTPLAQLALPSDDYAFIDRLWADWSPGYDPAWDVKRVREAIGSPERMLAAITYYRALYNGELHDPALADEQALGALPVPRPVLYLHGDSDGCFAFASIEDPLANLGPGSELFVVEGTGHFLHLEKPDAVNDRIVDFLAS